MKVRRPNLGDAVIVRWIDSGAGASCSPRRPLRLDVRETHGRVLALEARAGEPETLTLAMCSAGSRDTRSDLAAIWWPAVLSCRVVG